MRDCRLRPRRSEGRRRTVGRGLLALLAAGVLCGTALARQRAFEKYIWEAPAVTPAETKETKDLLARLDGEVAAIVRAGHLAPLRLPYSERPVFFYWLNAGDTLRALSMAIPFLSDARAAELKAYLKKELATHGLRPLPLETGARREGYPLPPDGPGRGRGDAQKLLVQRSYLYGVWCYAYYTSDYAAAIKLLPEMQRIARGIRDKSYEAISNYIGLARLAQKAGMTKAAADLAADARELLAEGRNFKAWAHEYNRRYNSVMRLRGTVYVSSCGILIDLSPEMGRFLADHARDQVAEVIAATTKRVPLWFIARGPGHVTLVDPAYMKMGSGQTQDEVSSAPPYTSGPIFFARTMVLGEDPAVMKTYLDVPQCKVGDLEYIEKLTALLRACGKVTWRSVK